MTTVNPSHGLPAQVARRRLKLPESRLEIALLDWGGPGPLVLLHHANGFCAALWAPIAEALSAHFRVVAMDARGHGDSSLPPDDAAAFAWTCLRDDLRFVAHSLLSERGEARVALGIGHSLGGTLSLGAAGCDVDLFERLILLDPVILPPMDAAAAAARAEEVGLAERSRRRRHVFESREEARAHFVERDLFASWRPEVLDLYVEEGMRERADGRVELKCPGSVEAHIFESAHTMDIFALSRRVRLPVHLLWARLGNFPRSVYEDLTAGMEQASVEDAEAGHLIPMERPDIVIDAVGRYCGVALGGSVDGDA